MTYSLYNPISRYIPKFVYDLLYVNELLKRETRHSIKDFHHSFSDPYEWHSCGGTSLGCRSDCECAFRREHDEYMRYMSQQNSSFCNAFGIGLKSHINTKNKKDLEAFCPRVAPVRIDEYPFIY